MREHHKPYEIMTLTEAASYIRVSEKTVGEYARRGSIPSQKVGREWRFLRHALEEWLSGRLELNGKPKAVQGAVMDKAFNVREPEVQNKLPFPGFRDTAFTENRDRSLHRWVPWIAGFSSTFVNHVLDKVAAREPGRLTVLDPFAGVGTTLIEALKRGHDTIGFEINPYAALACEVKVRAADYDVRTLKEKTRAFQAIWTPTRGKLPLASGLCKSRAVLQRGRGTPSPPCRRLHSRARQAVDSRSVPRRSRFRNGWLLQLFI